MSDRYAVMGNPIAHSKSPCIHTLFARQTEQDLIYTAILVEKGRFSEAVRGFMRAGGRGLNVTVPFKQEAWVFADTRTPRAERAGAVNTLVLQQDGRVHGDNTDGAGLVRDLTVNKKIEVKDRRILILGAGGATRGVLGPLLDEQPACLVIANRTPSKAVELAHSFHGTAALEGCGFPHLEGRRFDLIINATAAGLQGQTPPLPSGIVTGETWCYDMSYGDQTTPFVQWSNAQGAAGSCDGLGMLVEQAAESFYVWRSVRPDTGPVIEELYSRRARAPQPG
jgi:shikimate dehydrogenase